MKDAQGKFYWKPTQVLALGFLTVILAGTLLLCLPAAAADGRSVGFLTALFTATSCTCVTGLSVVEVGVALSAFGHAVMLVLIQIGGLGFMTAAALLFLLVGKKITLRERLTIAEGFNESGLKGMVRLVRRAAALTFGIEGAGAVLLCFHFVPVYGWAKGIWFSVFHSVSAFCNAGFDLIGRGDSIGMFRTSPLALVTFAALILLGGMGFAVIMDCWKKKSWKKFSLQSKIVLLFSGILLALGTILFLAAEYYNPQTLGSLSFGDKLANAFFESVTLRTAGFAAIPQGSLTGASLVLCCLMMFIGASPASTGGGMKTTTVFVVLLQVASVVRGKEDLTFSGRRLPEGLGRRAVAILCIGLMMVLCLVLGICLIEAPNGISTEAIVYESFSAIGTVGNSMGITAALSPASRVLVILAMFCGRVGPLTLALAFAGKSSRNGARYPEEKVMVG